MRSGCPILLVTCLLTNCRSFVFLLQLMEEFKEAHRKMFAHKDEDIPSTKPVSTHCWLAKAARHSFLTTAGGADTLLFLLYEVTARRMCVQLPGAAAVFHFGE